MAKISVVINTLNEEKNLPHAIATVANLASEIVVVDMESDDETVKIAKKLGAKVYSYKRTGYVEPARNFAISKATGEWILILDADEQISSGLAKKLKDISEGDEGDYFRLPRKNLIFDKWIRHTGWWPDYNIRFFRKGTVVWNEVIHSVPETLGRGIDVEASAQNAIVHNNYKTIDQYIERLNRYTTHQAAGRVKDGYKFEWRDVITKPANEFLRRFFAAEGYKDGVHGLGLSVLQAFSEFVVYLKVWQMEGFKEKEVNVKEVGRIAKDLQKDFRYWESDAQVASSGGIVPRIKRKFKL